MVNFYRDMGNDSPMKKTNDARGAMRRAKDKVKVGNIYLLPLRYVSEKSDSHPKMKCICTGKYQHFATFENHKGISQSFTYYDLATIAKI